MWFSALLFCIAKVQGDIPPDQGPYTVYSDNVYVGGYIAGNLSIQTAQIWYPEPKSSTEKFPFLVFMHGMTAGGIETPIAYLSLIEAVSSWGFIVLAPESCRLVYCYDSYVADGLHTLDAARANTSMHSSLATADFSRVGVFGHSMGGAATIHMANRQLSNDYNFLGGVALHPSTEMGDSSEGVKCPLWYATGSADNVVPPEYPESSYGVDPIKPKVFAEITGAGHLEPTTLGQNRWTPYVCKYLVCHVMGDESACPYIYANSSSSLCGQKTIPMTKCVFEQ